MSITETLALSMGLGWASGINLYAAVFMLGVLHQTGNVALPPDLVVLADPIVIFAAGLMYCIEFFADKVPGVDSAWDAVHSFIRIPAGAVLAAQAVGPISPAAEIAAGLLGGTLAAGSHMVKAGSRLAINASPEPFSNWTASISEDLMVVGGVWAALYHPWLFLAGLVLFIAAAIWALPRIWRGLQRILALLTRPFRASPPAAVRATSLPDAPPPADGGAAEAQRSTPP